VRVRELEHIPREQLRCVHRGIEQELLLVQNEVLKSDHEIDAVD